MEFLAVKPHEALDTVCSNSGSKVYVIHDVEPLEKYLAARNGASRFGFKVVDSPTDYVIYDSKKEQMEFYSGPVSFAFTALCVKPAYNYTWVVILGAIGAAGVLALIACLVRKALVKRRTEVTYFFDKIEFKTIDVLQK